MIHPLSIETAGLEQAAQRRPRAADMVATVRSKIVVVSRYPRRRRTRPRVRSRLRSSQVGDPAVGKTALVQMFNSNGQRFPKHYMMTLGVEFCVKSVMLQDADTNVELHIFDTAGQVALS